MSLDDSVSTYVAGVPEESSVTLQQLCDGTSGIGSFASQLLPLWLTNPTRVWDPARARRLRARARAHHRAGRGLRRLRCGIRPARPRARACDRPECLGAHPEVRGGSARSRRDAASRRSRDEAGRGRARCSRLPVASGRGRPRLRESAGHHRALRERRLHRRRRGHDDRRSRPLRAGARHGRAARRRRRSLRAPARRRTRTLPPWNTADRRSHPGGVARRAVRRGSRAT